MEVASPPFRPRAAERPRRNRDLIPARPHDRLEGDRVAADPDPACLGVVERWNCGPSGESILPSNSGAIELAIPLIADSWQPIPIGEVAAVPDDESIGSVVAEAVRRDMHREAEMQRVAGLERLLQRINSVAEVVIHEHGRRGPVDGYSSGFDPRDGGYMDGVDRRGTGVREDVGAADLRLPPIGINLDAKVGAREGGVRDARIPSVAPLVLGAPLRLPGRGTVPIERVGIVEDETAQGDDQRHRRRGHADRRPRGTTARQVESRP